MDEAHDRRAYFRIDDSVQCRYRVVDGPDREQRALCGDPDKECDFTVMSRLAAIGRQGTALLRRIESRDPELAEYLSLLDQKIETLGRAFIAHEAEFRSFTAMPVNLSAGGMAMQTRERYARGTLLELHLLLLPGLEGLICHAEVVSCEALASCDDDYGFVVRLCYRHLRERERDLLIRHILRKQGERLRGERVE